MAITKSSKQELSLDHGKPNEKCGCTLATPYALMRPLILNSQITISSLGSYTPLHMKDVSQLNKWARDIKWTSRGCIYTPHSIPIVMCQLSIFRIDRTRRSMWPNASGRWQWPTLVSNALSDRTRRRVRSGVTWHVWSLETFSENSLFHLHGWPDAPKSRPISSPSRPVANPSRVDRRQHYLRVRSKAYQRLVT
jgi:hypothetical protein